MLPPEEAEIKLLSSIETTSELGYIVREGITPDSFLSHGRVFSHMLDYSRTYGNMPAQADMESEFEVTFSAPGDLEFYLRELLRIELIRNAHSIIVTRLGKKGINLRENPEEVVRRISEDLRKVQKTSRRHVAWLDRDAMTRVGWLRETAAATAEGKVLGIPTGLSCFDAQAQGWGPGEAIMVMAPKGTGKSWVSMYFGVMAYNAGFKVLYLSPEMVHKECAYRFDVLLAYQRGIRLSHSGLTTGRQDEAEYSDWLESLTSRDQFIVIDSPDVGGFTTENVLSLIDEHRPDLAILDGLHLVGGDARLSGWEIMKQAADALKATAQHLNCAVMWTSQTDRAAMRNSTEPAASGASAAYGKAGVEAANRLITLANSDDSRVKHFKVPNNRNGLEWHTTQRLRFDVDAGYIEQMPNPVIDDDGAF